MQDIRQLDRLAATSTAPATPPRSTGLQVLPIKLRKIGRTAVYGSYFNFYLCNFEAASTSRRSRSPIRDLLLDGRSNLSINYPEDFPGTTLGERCNLG